MTYNIQFTKFLEAACSTVQDFENNAALCVETGDSTEYVRIMREKATFLSALAENAQSTMTGLPTEVAQEARQRLQRFSTSAGQALRLDSTFYMSALLFADSHQPGQPNDLDIFTAEMRRRLA